MTIKLKKISKMERLAFENALRIHFDSILLFDNNSFPSAFYFSVIAQEEFGKASMLDDFVFYKWNLTEKEEREWIRLIYNHTHKQGAFIRQALLSLNKNFVKEVYEGLLEPKKQNSLYVGLTRLKGKLNVKGRIISPISVRKQKAVNQITVVNDYLIDWVNGVLNDYYTWDNEEIEGLMTQDLLKKLKESWSVSRIKKSV